MLRSGNPTASPCKPSWTPFAISLPNEIETFIYTEHAIFSFNGETLLVTFNDKSYHQVLFLYFFYFKDKKYWFS